MIFKGHYSTSFYMLRFCEHGQLCPAEGKDKPYKAPANRAIRPGTDALSALGGLTAPPELPPNQALPIRQSSNECPAPVWGGSAEAGPGSPAVGPAWPGPQHRPPCPALLGGAAGRGRAGEAVPGRGAAMADEEEDAPVSARGAALPGHPQPGRGGAQRGGAGARRALTVLSPPLCSSKRTRRTPAGAWTAGRAGGRGCSPKSVSGARALS